MRFSMLKTIYFKELLDILRDRRTLISMVIVPIVVIPAILQLMTFMVKRVQTQADAEAKSLGVVVQTAMPGVKEAVEKAGFTVVEKSDPRQAILDKQLAAAVQEKAGPGGVPQLELIVDRSNPTSDSAASKIQVALNEVRDVRIKQELQKAGVPPTILTPFLVKRENIASERKMAGVVWGSMLGYMLLLLMFTGGMYPVIDMTAGEKERKTLEAFLASPATRQEIVLGKTLTAMTAILMTAMLTLGSLVFSLKRAQFGPNKEMQALMGTVPLDTTAIVQIALCLIPLAIFAASIMMAIAVFARSFKEGQSYLTPLAMLVVFPALMGGLPGVTLNPTMALVPIFNTSLAIRGVLLGDISLTNVMITVAANIVYAAIAMFIATKVFERESVLFRS
jgi:sodium transport system permease protein